MSDSETFEQQIHRIYELLEGSGAQVTWDDHIPDPDNPSQPRQIDISIKKDGKLILVECRDHKSRQDVQWIEELIGRRTSLGADSLIAVSSSGFTAGALKKANRYGIIPRDLRELTDREIKSWGSQVAVTVYFYQYSDLEVSLCFKPESIPRLDKTIVESQLKYHPALQSLFNAAAQQLGTLNLISGEDAGRTVKFGLRLQFDGFQLSGESVMEVDFRGSACLVSREMMASAVFAYGKPSEGSHEREVTVETFELGGTSIIHDANRISVFLDISKLEMPPFCQFRFFQIVGNEEMDHEAFELTGWEKLWVQGRMRISICCKANS
jgi:Restriction endonuclease